MFEVKLSSWIDGINALRPSIVGAKVRDIKVEIKDSTMVMVGHNGNKDSAGWIMCKVEVPVVNMGNYTSSLVVSFSELYDSVTVHYKKSETVKIVVLATRDSRHFMGIKGDSFESAVGESCLPAVRKEAEKGFDVPENVLAYEQYNDKTTYTSPIFSMLNRNFVKDLQRVMHPCRDLKDECEDTYKFVQVDVTDKGMVGFTCLDDSRFAEIIASDALVSDEYISRIYTPTKISKKYTGKYVRIENRYFADKLLILGDTIKKIMPELDSRLGEMYFTDNVNNVIISTTLGEIAVSYYMFCVHTSIVRPVGLTSLSRKILLTMSRDSIMNALAELSCDGDITLETSEKGDTLTMSNSNAVSVTDIPCLTSGIYKTASMTMSVKYVYLLEAMLSLYGEEFVTFGLGDKTCSMSIFTASLRQTIMPETFKTWYRTTYTKYGDSGYEGYESGYGYFPNHMNGKVESKFPPVKALTLHERMADINDKEMAELNADVPPEHSPYYEG